MLVSINLTLQGLPADMPALNPWPQAVQAWAEFHGAFATSIVTDAAGAEFYGHSGRSYPPEYEPGGLYHTEAYLKFIQRGLEAWRKGQALKTDAALTAAVRAAKLAEHLAAIRAEMQPLDAMGPEENPPGWQPTQR